MNEAEVAGILREAGLENRFEILRLLEREQGSLITIKRHLRSLGVNKPHTTVARYLDRLKALNLIKEEGEQFALTNQGCLLLQYCEEISRNIQVLNKLKKYPTMDTLSLLPAELLKEVWVLGEAEVIEDVYAGLAMALKAAKESREKMWIITWVASVEFTENNILKALNGVEVFALIESSTVPLRGDIKRKLDIPLKLNDPEISSRQREKFLIKKFMDLPLQLMAFDSSIAGIQFLDPKTRSLSPYFISKEPEFINWAEKIFKYYWERGEPVVIY